MSERLDWSQQSREKQKLMSEALAAAKDKVQELVEKNFRYIDQDGVERIKRYFTWTEFAPKDQSNKKLLDKKDVLGALGVDTDDKAPDNYQSQKKEDGTFEEVWPTLIPGLYYFHIRPADKYSDEEDYFVVETLGDWNKRMWDQPDADKKADEELRNQWDK